MVLKSVQFFCYGTIFEMKTNRKIQKCVGILCQTNYSFMEVLPLSTYTSVKSVFLYHIQSLTRVDTSSGQEKWV